MYERLMQCETPPENPRQPRAPKPVPTANYPALVEVLTGLHQIPDGLGETILTYEEATAIRACGFGARASSIWRCPPLPDALVSFNPLLQHLSDAIDPMSRTATWNKKRAPSRIASEYCPLALVESKILRHLHREPYFMSKRRLQQLLWRYPAKFFNQTLSRMLARGRITLYDGYLFPYDRATFTEVVQPEIDKLNRANRTGYTGNSGNRISYRKSS
jgi:hypothetical protein